VISPGPGTPERAGDVGIVPRLLRTLTDTPILGVCLGHQTLASVHGASVIHAPEPCHGRLSDIEHDGHKLFKGIPSGKGSGFRVVRYHSLIVDEESLPGELRPICWTAGGHVALAMAGEQAKVAAGGDRLLMGIAHTKHPHFGVQYHPESVATQFGSQLLRNFAELTAEVVSLAGFPEVPENSTRVPQLIQASSSDHEAQTRAQSCPLRLEWRCMDGTGIKSAALMQAMGWSGSADTFWLDSEASDRARFSFLGGPGGCLWRRFTFKLPVAASASSGAARQGAADRCTRGCIASNAAGDSTTAKCPEGTLTEIDATGAVSHRKCHCRIWLREFLRAHSLVPDSRHEELPFDFVGGLVGYIGYEMKAESTGKLTHDSRCVYGLRCLCLRCPGFTAYNSVPAHVALVLPHTTVYLRWHGWRWVSWDGKGVVIDGPTKTMSGITRVAVTVSRSTHGVHALE
jgi:para-aminobenzoate synthetase